MNRVVLLLCLFIPSSWAVCALNHYSVRELVRQAEESHAYLGENLERIKRLNNAQTYAHLSMEAVVILVYENTRLTQENARLVEENKYLLDNYDYMVELVDELTPVAEAMRKTLIENGLEVPDPWPLPLPPTND
jgi:hypothetical protein